MCSPLQVQLVLMDVESSLIDVDREYNISDSETERSDMAELS